MFSRQSTLTGTTHAPGLSILKTGITTRVLREKKKDIALLFPKFFAKRPDWKILVVSGTADAAVPFIGTQRWMGCLGRNVVNDTRSWLLDGQVAGSIMDWEGISLATVKGCGHMIPLYCPEAGYAFFANWLSGKW